jgi:type II secretory pathway pseudopilin PulG
MENQILMTTLEIGKKKCHGSQNSRKNSATKQNSAFTLLEIITSMALVVLILSLSIPALNTTMREESLRQAARKIQALVRTGRQDAIRSQQSRVLRLIKEKKHSTLLLISGSQANTQNPEVLDVVKIELPLRLLHKTWPAQTWGYDTSKEWFIQPSGLIEPLQFRIEKNQDWIEFEFHPLTGNIVEERFLFP